MQRLYICLGLLLGLLAATSAQVTTVATFTDEIERASVRTNLVVQTQNLSLTQGFLINERAPPCSLVRYPVPQSVCTGADTLSYNMWVLDFKLKTCVEANATQPLECDAESVTTSAKSDVKVGIHIYDSTAKTDTYFPATFCTIGATPDGDNGKSADAIVNNGEALRCFYWCTGICQEKIRGQSVNTEVWVSTSGDEQKQGIIYDLRLFETLIPVRPLALGATLTSEKSSFWAAVSNNTLLRVQPNNHLGFVSPAFLEHYWVDVGPTGAIPGLFWAYATPDAVLRFSVDQVHIVTSSNVTRHFTWTGTADQWQITLNRNDIAIGTFDAGFAGTASIQNPTVASCVLDKCRDAATDNEVICRTTGAIQKFTDSLDVNLYGCDDVLKGTQRIFVAVRVPSTLPTDVASPTGYNYRVWARFMPRTDRCLPSSKLRTFTANGMVMTGNLAPARTVNAASTEDNYFMVNYGPSYAIPADSGISNPYLVFTLYNVKYGTAALEITKGKEARLGHDNNCKSTLPRLYCHTFPDDASKENINGANNLAVKDYCRVVVRNCDALCGLTCPRQFVNNCTVLPPFHGTTLRDSFRTLRFGDGEDYFATVYATSVEAIAAAANPTDTNVASGRESLDYALKVDVYDDTAMDIRQGKSSAGSTWVSESDDMVSRYTHISSVEEQLYKHYFITFSVEEANNPETFFDVELYSNHEQEDVVFYFNKGSLAGQPQPMEGAEWNSLAKYSRGMVTDTCYKYLARCETREKNEGDDAGNQNNVCKFRFQFCQIDPNVPYYFSVYGLSTSERLGYDRSVSYTVSWTIRTAQTITDRVTTSEMIPLSQPSTDFTKGLLAMTMSHQYKFNIPASLVRFVERVRVRFADFQHQNDNELTLTGFLQCGRAAGQCPCYSAIDTKQATWNNWGGNDDNKDHGWNDLVADACLCTSTTYYVSFSVSAQSDVSKIKDLNNRPGIFTLTPYLEMVDITGEIQLSVDDKMPNITTGRLLLNPITNTYIPQTYVVRNPSTNPNDVLEVVIRWVHLQEKPFQYERVMLHLNRNAPPRLVDDSNTAVSSLKEDTCGVKCVADMQKPGNGRIKSGDWSMFDDCSWCSIVVNECQFVPGDYVIRVWANPDMSDFKDHGKDQEKWDQHNIPIDFTLYSRIYSKEPVTLAANVPRADAVREYHYNHYVFPTQGIPANAYVKAELYVDRDQKDELFFMWTYGSNVTTRAGFPLAPNCHDKNSFLDDYRCPTYNFNRFCRTSYETTKAQQYHREREFCSFYLQPCDVPAGTDILLSVYAPGSQRRMSAQEKGNYHSGAGSAWNTMHMWGSELSYTVQMSVQIPVPLSLSNGWPMTGNVHAGEKMYYEFTVSAGDFFNENTAGSFLTFEVDSIRPEVVADNTMSRVKTMVINPETPAPGSARCPCTNVHYFDEFEHRLFYCDLQPLPKTYYLEVLGLRGGMDKPWDPISYTVRAYKTDIPFETVPVVANTRQHPLDTFLSNTTTIEQACSQPDAANNVACPLTATRKFNFEEWYAYKIDFTAGTGNEILYVEIMDVRALKATTDGLFHAFLQRDHAGSPASFWRDWGADENDDYVYNKFKDTKGHYFFDHHHPMDPTNRMLGSNPMAKGCHMASCVSVAGNAESVTFDAKKPIPSCILQLGGCLSGSGSFYLTIQSIVKKPYADCVDPAFSLRVRARSAPFDRTTLSTFDATLNTTSTSRPFTTTANALRVVSNVANKIHRYWMVSPSITVPQGGYFMASPSAGTIKLSLHNTADVGSSASPCMSECNCPATLKATVPAGSKCFVNCRNAALTSEWYIMVETEGAAENVNFEVSLEVGYPPTILPSVTVPIVEQFNSTGQEAPAVWQTTGIDNLPEGAPDGLGEVPPYSAVSFVLSPYQLVSAGNHPLVTITWQVSGGNVFQSLGTEASWVSPYCSSATAVTGALLEVNWCKIQNSNLVLTVFNPTGAAITARVRATYVRRSVSLTASAPTAIAPTTDTGIFDFSLTNTEWGKFSNLRDWNAWAFFRFSVTKPTTATAATPALRWRVTWQANLYSKNNATLSNTNIKIRRGTNCFPGTDADCGGTADVISVCTGNIDDKPGTCYFEFPMCNVVSGTYVLGVKAPILTDPTNHLGGTALRIQSVAADPLVTLNVGAVRPFTEITNAVAIGGGSTTFNDVMTSTFYKHYQFSVSIADILGAATGANTALLDERVSDVRIQVALSSLQNPTERTIEILLSDTGLAGSTGGETQSPFATDAGSCYSATTGFTCERITIASGKLYDDAATVKGAGVNSISYFNTTGNVAQYVSCTRPVCDLAKTSNCDNDNSLSNMFTFFASVRHTAGAAYVKPAGTGPDAENAVTFGLSVNLQDYKKPVTLFKEADVGQLYVIMPLVNPVAGPPNVFDTTTAFPFTNSADGGIAVPKSTYNVTLPSLGDPNDVIDRTRIAKFLYFPIDTAGFQEGDYLAINVTLPDNRYIDPATAKEVNGNASPLTFALWKADTCETKSAKATFTTDNTLEHYRGHAYFQTDPCHFADGLQSGNTRWWLRVSQGGGELTQPFNLYVSRMTPVRKTVSLVPSLPGLTPTQAASAGSFFEETVALWEERWVQYRICIPSSYRRENLYVSVTTHCTGIDYWTNWQDFRFASADCSDATARLDAGKTFVDIASSDGNRDGMNTCRYTGGCYHISVKVPNKELAKFLPLDSRKGRMLVDNPQASFTIKAWAVTAPIMQLPLECPFVLHHLEKSTGEVQCGGPTQLFFMDHDYENFGTPFALELKDSQTNEDTDPTVTVVTPWYWRRVGSRGDSMYVPTGLFGQNYLKTAFGSEWIPAAFTKVDQSARDCSLATVGDAAADNGVISFDKKHTFTPCSFENGRYYITVTGIPKGTINVNRYALIGTYTTMYVPVVSLSPMNMFTATYISTVGKGQYQFYKAIIDRNTAQVVEFKLTGSGVTLYVTQTNFGRRHVGTNFATGSLAANGCSNVNVVGNAATVPLCDEIKTTDPKSLEQFFVGVKANTGSCKRDYTLTIRASLIFKTISLDTTYCDSVVPAGDIGDFMNAWVKKPLSVYGTAPRVLYRLDVPESVRVAGKNVMVEVRALRASVDTERGIKVSVGKNRVPALGDTDKKCTDFTAATTVETAQSYPDAAHYASITLGGCGTNFVPTYWIAIDLPEGATKQTFYTIDAHVATCTPTPTSCWITDPVAALAAQPSATPLPEATVLSSDEFVAVNTRDTKQVFKRVFSYDDLIPNALVSTSIGKVVVEVADVSGCAFKLSYGNRIVGKATCPTATTGDLTPCAVPQRFETPLTALCTSGDIGSREFYVSVMREETTACTAPDTCKGSSSTFATCVDRPDCDLIDISGYKIRIFYEATLPPCTITTLPPQNACVKTLASGKLSDLFLSPKDDASATRIFHYWSFPAGTEGFVHASISLARGFGDEGTAAAPTGVVQEDYHDLEAKLYRGGCAVAKCTTGAAVTACAGDAAGSTSEGSMSCYVHDHWRNHALSLPAEAKYYLVVKPVTNGPHWYHNYASYSVYASNGFTDLASTGCSDVEIHGFDRHYYKVAASEAGVPKSVVVHITVNHGPRIVIDAADTPHFVDWYGSSNGLEGTVGRAQTKLLTGTDDVHAEYDTDRKIVGYRGWTRRQVAEHGEVDIEIATRAMHPHSDYIYIWVSPEQMSTDTAPCEKPTVYSISATVGSENCGASLGSGFCSDVGTGGDSLGTIFTPKNATMKHQEAKCRFDDIVQCYCPKPSGECLNALKAFSCYESFHECDPDGFWVGTCRDQCSLVEELCGPWINPSGCNCKPEYTCSCNDRYLDGPDTGATVCTGTIRPETQISPGVPPGSPVIPPTIVPGTPGASPGVDVSPGGEGPQGPQGPKGPPGPPGPGTDEDIVDVRVDLLNSAPSLRMDVLLVICSLIIALLL